MAQQGDFRVSGLDFPFYCGHWIHLKTLGYMGGSRTKELDKLLGGIEGNNKWIGSPEKAENYRVRYFIENKEIYVHIDGEGFRVY